MDGKINIEEISHLPYQEQAEIIAEKFSSIQNEYDPLNAEDIYIPPFTEEEIPVFSPAQVWQILTQLKTNKATVPGDFPAKLTKIFAAYLAESFADIINSIRRGKYNIILTALDSNS